jgi:hypothetical protein
MTLMTNKDLDRIASEIPFVKAWIAAVEKEIKKAIETGETFQHVSLVPTQAQRKWRSGVNVLELLHKFSPLDVVAPRKVMSPAEAEKTFGKKLFLTDLSEHVVKESSGTKLAYSTEELEN